MTGSALGEPPNNARICFCGVHRGKTGLNNNTYSLIVDCMICIMAPLCQARGSGAETRHHCASGERISIRILYIYKL